MRAVIDWTSDDSHVLLNPRLPATTREQLERVVPALPRHVFIATSGTSGVMKLVALSKGAILASAEAVNERLGVTNRDVWVRVLPRFHVGGLGIEARAHVAGARIIDMQWEPAEFARSAGTVVSLVPAQVHDLVKQRLRPPSSLRHVLVGGGAFDVALQNEARALGWPVLASYGMSEAASTISVENELLSHIEARQEADGRIAVRGRSLLTSYVLPDGTIVDPKIDGWFVSDDLGFVDGRKIRISGRASDFVKIGGESVDLNRLDTILNGLRGDTDAAVYAAPDERLGAVIHLAVVGEEQSLVDAFNAQVAPFERIRAVRRVSRIPRTALGKLLRAELAKVLE